MQARNAPSPGWQSVVGERGVVAKHEAIDDEPLLDRRDRAANTLVAGGKEPDERHEQQARVDSVRAVRLHERCRARGSNAFSQTSSWMLLAKGAPAVERPIEMTLLGAVDGAIERDPGHDLGMGEVLRRAAHFPDARDPGCCQTRFEMLDERALELPGVVALGHVAAARLVQGVHHLAEDVELELPVRGVADAHGTRALVAGQPRHLPLEQPALAAEAVHDLHLVGAAGGGAQQPVAPGARPRRSSRASISATSVSVASRSQQKR